MNNNDRKKEPRDLLVANDNESLSFLKTLSERYKIERKIGKGSFGIVYLALCKKNSGRVALKVIDKRNEEYNGYKKVSTMNEHVALAVLKHPNIVEMKEYITSVCYDCLVLEYCSLGDVYSHVYLNGKMNESEVKRCCAQMASALEYSHRQGYAHRDIKLENIFMSLDVKTGEVVYKLGDWGLATRWSKGRKNNESIGSPYYASPEIFKCSHEGPEVDSWSLGVSLYIMASASMPFYALGNDNTRLIDYILKCRYQMAAKNFISQEGWDFIQKIFVLEKRLSVEEMLYHPWLLPVSQSMSDPKRGYNNTIASTNTNTNPLASETGIDMLPLPKSPKINVRKRTEEAAVTSRLKSGCSDVSDSASSSYWTVDLTSEPIKEQKRYEKSVHSSEQRCKTSPSTNKKSFGEKTLHNLSSSVPAEALEIEIEGRKTRKEEHSKEEEWEQKKRKEKEKKRHSGKGVSHRGLKNKRPSCIWQSICGIT